MEGTSEQADFEALLEYVKRSRGFDFTGYKRSSLMRRVDKRMQSVEIEGYGNYLDYLEVHPEEFNHLFNALLINVTSFFRDRSVWEYVQSEIVPQILDRKSPDEPIRIWSAGCASGEEAYTITIVLIAVMGIEAFQERVKIYATDINEEALAQAWQATYLERDLVGLTDQQIENFFEQTDGRYTFRKDLRRSVVFGRHDLIQDAPISRIDLLICRNTLMYLNAETQSHILARFHFALRERGFLLLGRAEMLLTHTHTFKSIHVKYRGFTKVPKFSLRNGLLTMVQLEHERALSLSTYAPLWEAAFNASPLPQLVVDVQGLLLLVNDRARGLFNLTARDVGRPLQDLTFSYRPVELRLQIQQAYANRQTVQLQEVEWQMPQGEALYFDVQVVPLVDAGNTILGASINFIDVSRYKRLREELEHSKQELELAYEELQSTSEELETTNEELQWSNEELETANEELQSTNEELETTNEELQSTNEELQTMNDELQYRREALEQSNTFLRSILGSLKSAVIVVDRNLNVQIWNDKAEELWGPRFEEVVEQNFLSLNIGLPTEQLRQPIQDCLADTVNTSLELIVNAINFRGRNIQCRILCTALRGGAGEVVGAILLMEEQPEVE
jgi:two-component system CheB/CheR fusion protein